MPSPVHPQRPGKLSQLILPAWRDHDVQKELADQFGLPVLVDNDANLGALAEVTGASGREVIDALDLLGSLPRIGAPIRIVQKLKLKPKGK